MHGEMPEVINFVLWPLVLRYILYIHNIVPSRDDGHFQLELFDGIICRTKMKENDTFGCPGFSLQNFLQGDNVTPKWSPHSRLGVSHGPSPLYTCNKSLVLNIFTGVVSSKYHSHDNFFKTTHYSKQDIATPSRWQQLVGSVGSNGDKSLEMHDMAKQGNDTYMTEAASKMLHNIQELTQATTCESTATSNKTMKSDLVSAPTKS